MFRLMRPSASETGAENLSNVPVASREERDALISQVNNAMLKIFAPSIGLLVLVFIFGIIGNVLVLVVARRRRIKLSAHAYMVALALTDLVVCATVVPYQIVSFIWVLASDEYPAGVCKTLEWFKYGMVAASAILLVTIAIDRYVAVCKPFVYRQFSPKRAAIISIIVITLGLSALTMKAFLENKSAYDLRDLVATRYYLRAASGLSRDTIPAGVQVYICETSHPNFKMIYSFVGTAFVVFTSCVVIPFVCYCLVYREVRNTQSFLMAHSSVLTLNKVTDLDTKSAMSGLSGKNVNSSSDHVAITYSLARDEDVDFRSSSESLNSVHSIIKHRVKLDRTQRKAIKHLRKQFSFARIFLVVTVVFILLWLPFWVINIVQIISEEFDSTLNSTTASAWFLFEILYFVNNAVNPFIYIVVSTEFRAELKTIFSRRQTNKSKQYQTSDSPAVVDRVENRDFLNSGNG